MEGEIKNSMKVSFILITSLTYCYFISSKISKGKFRLLSILPIIILFTILPQQLSYLFPRAIACLFISWLANFKFLLFAFNQGPLSFDNSPKSLPHFILITCLPIKIQQHNLTYDQKKENPIPQNSQKAPPKFPLNWPIKVLIFAILVGLHDLTKVHVAQALSLLYCCMAYLIVDIIFGPCSAIVHTVLRLELEPPSDEPYFSTSFQDFWGRRWNLMVTNVLRHTIYKPIRSSLGPMLGPWALLLGVLAAFLVSGLMHELLFYYVTRKSHVGSYMLLCVTRSVFGGGTLSKTIACWKNPAASGGFRSIDSYVCDGDDSVVILPSDCSDRRCRSSDRRV